MIPYDADETSREALGAQLAADRGLTIVPPYDDPYIVAGQGTAVKELIEEVGEIGRLEIGRRVPPAKRAGLCLEPHLHPASARRV